MDSRSLLDTKYNALEDFTRRLLANDVKDQIAKIILFGSMARGDARQDSDIDVLVFGFGDLRKLFRMCAEVAFDILMESGEYIQVLTYCIDDLSPPRSYFLYRVMLYGKEIYSMGEEELKKRELEGYLSLAQEYLEVAESSLAEERYRVAVDTAYNAAESCARGLLLLRLPELPRSHRGLITKFSEQYTKDGPLPKKLGRTLNTILGLRGKARYDANSPMGKEEAQDAIELARTLMQALESKLPPAD
jgi:uncharacterized protein (UPF0332 family)/predicted nucleotidyltransferase